MTASEVKELIQQFETCKLPKEKWTHEAHFAMALWYCCQLPLPFAIQSIKDGIKRYNISVGGANNDDSGYHETITVFYTKLIIDYILQDDPCRSFDEKLPSFLKQPFLSKDFPLRYYTKELLMSKEARKQWISPDIQPLG
jgi:hypothetical protein